MTCWIVGAGAIGCVLGAKLSQHTEVTFVDPWRAHVDYMNETGLTVDYPDGTLHVKVRALHLNEIGLIGERPDVVLLAVKSGQTESTVGSLLPYLDEKSVIVSLQNGINEDTIASLAGPERTIGAMVRFDGTLHGPGHASSRQRTQRLVIGELNGIITDRLQSVGALLQGGVSTELTDNIYGALWTKMVRNAELSPVGAVTGLGTAEIAVNEITRKVALSLGMETVRVALRLGMVLDAAELLGAAEAYLQPLTSDVMAEVEERFSRSFPTSVRPSMLTDVDNGRPTEIDYMNGYIVRKGKEVGVLTPFNERLVALVKEVEAGTRRPTTQVIDEVLSGLLGELAA